MKYFLLLIGFILMAGCSQKLPDASATTERVAIFPDYAEVTIPSNLAPLNFKLQQPTPGIALLSYGEHEIRIDSPKGIFEIPLRKWNKLIRTAAGKDIKVTLYTQKDGSWHRHEPFNIHVAAEPIDAYIAYRRITPGYRMWNEMGIYQRCLENFKELTILSNKNTDNNCMNCHSFCMQNPEKMLFHQRADYAGTYFIIDGKIEKLNTKTPETISALVYPSWHPSGRFVAFSTNETKQDFHYSDSNRIEVFDQASDVVIYDIEKHEIITTPSLFSRENFETFPTFSPDGKTLYFCSAPAIAMPDSFRQVRYNLLSIAFDSETRTFGKQIDTLYNAQTEGKSAKFPRVSPDGKFLLYTLSNYGNFSIWHKDADLQMLHLEDGATDSLSDVNSSETDSYHSWSSNSRWFIFSSRRIDGLYTRPYICYIDAQGKTGKPFLLPQQHTDYYEQSLFSFNVPELIKGKINIDTYELVRISKSESGKNISFAAP